MSVSGVSQIENGKRNLSTATLAKLAEAFGVEVRDLFPKAQAPLQLELEVRRGADKERREEELDTALAKKLQQQLDTQLRVLRERRSIARHEEDLHEAEKDFHYWWLFTFDWLSTILRIFPEGAGPELEEAVNRAYQAHRHEVTQDAPNPRYTQDMAEVLQEWEAPQDAGV